MKSAPDDCFGRTGGDVDSSVGWTVAELADTRSA
jgi:hypothetical protein